MEREGGESERVTKMGRGGTMTTSHATTALL